MREIRSYGSVRGVAGDRYPYRDPTKLFLSAEVGTERMLAPMLHPGKCRTVATTRSPGSHATKTRIAKPKHFQTRSTATHAGQEIALSAKIGLSMVPLSAARHHRHHDHLFDGRADF